MRYIGDIHCKTDAYRLICDDAPGTRSVQVGDHGYGIMGSYKEAQALDYARRHPGHRFIRGNHDDPDTCRRTPHWIADGTYEASTDTLYVGGAFSIDREWLTPGFDWWPDEELSDRAFDEIVETAKQARPRIIVTHDAPFGVAEEMFMRGTHKELVRNRTSSNLELLFKAHKPQFWVFGHWHMRRVEKIRGTQFICLEELGYIDID